MYDSPRNLPHHINLHSHCVFLLVRFLSCCIKAIIFANPVLHTLLPWEHEAVQHSVSNNVRPPCSESLDAKSVVSEFLQLVAILYDVIFCCRFFVFIEIQNSGN